MDGYTVRGSQSVAGRICRRIIAGTAVMWGGHNPAPAVGSEDPIGLLIRARGCWGGRRAVPNVRTFMVELSHRSGEVDGLLQLWRWR